MTRDDKLDALLAQGRLGGPRRDQILTGAMAAAGVRRTRWRSVGVWVGSLAAAAAALIVFARPNAFRARGGDGPALEVACVGGELGSCPSGTKLVFRVATSEPGF